jgi:hypothetical protein
MGDLGSKPPKIIKNAAPEMKNTLWGCFGEAQVSPAPVFLTKRRTWQPACPSPSPVAADVRRLQLKPHVYFQRRGERGSPLPGGEGGVRASVLCP